MTIFEELIQTGRLTQLNANIILANFNICSTEDWFWEAFISDYDKHRLATIKIERSRSRVLLRLAIVRIILGSYLDYPPDKILFQKNKYGKPYIACPVTNINFNISHSDETIIVIIDLDKEIGIDIETSNSFKKRNFQLFKDIYADHELRRYLMLSKFQQFEMFCRTWVVKEAVIKALGLGLTIELKTIDLPVLERNKSIKLSLTGYHQNVQIQFIDYMNNYIGIAYCEE